MTITALENQPSRKERRIETSRLFAQVADATDDSQHDRLVAQVILPERALQIAAGDDPKPTLASLESQWKELKERWK